MSGRRRAGAPAPKAPDRATRWSTDLPGFGERHYRTGSISYVVQTRMRGRLRTVTIGTAAVMSEAEAKRIARHLLLRAQTGEDPADRRVKARSAPSYADFLDGYWQRMEVQWKPSSRTTNGIYRRLYLDGAFAGRFMDEIRQADVLRWFVRVTEKCGPGGANRCLALLAAIFAKAEQWGDRVEGTNPCRGIRRNRPRRFQRFLSAEELGRLGAMLAEDECRRSDRVAAIRLLLLTGCRKSEILNLEWRDVKGDRLQLRDGKTGSRTVWLGREARAILGAVERRSGAAAIFHDGDPDRTGSRLHNYWRHMIRRADLPALRLHDLRHSFASQAARSSETLPMIGKLLGHKKVGSTSRYAHLDDGHLKAAAQEIGDAVERMLFPDTVRES